MLNLAREKLEMPSPEAALPGRATPIATAERHFVSGHPLKGPYPEGMETAYFALGCYWGAERLYWNLPGVWVTAVGNMGGFTPNPTYQEVGTGRTGHAETVMVVFDPGRISYGQLVATFFEAHDPTQYMRQGNDIGTSYRSALFPVGAAQLEVAQAAKAAYGQALKARGLGAVVTEITPAGPFYFAEDYHQQYLAKNPNGYCGLRGTGVACVL